MENNLYNLYKKIYNSELEKKIYIYDNFEKITSQLNINNFKKEAKGSHDPETIEDIEKLLESLEKHLIIDEDISFSELGVFLHPMSMSVKKITLRPLKIIGMVKILKKLSKKYSKAKKEKDNKKLKEIKKEFISCLNKIKEQIKEQKIIKKTSSNKSQSHACIEKNWYNQFK